MVRRMPLRMLPPLQLRLPFLHLPLEHPPSLLLTQQVMFRRAIVRDDVGGGVVGRGGGNARRAAGGRVARGRESANVVPFPPADHALFALKTDVVIVVLLVIALLLLSPPLNVVMLGKYLSLSFVLLLLPLLLLLLLLLRLLPLLLQPQNLLLLLLPLSFSPITLVALVPHPTSPTPVILPGRRVDSTPTRRGVMRRSYHLIPCWGGKCEKVVDWGDGGARDFNVKTDMT